MTPTAHLVFCRSRTVLTKKGYADWRQVQDEYEDYMTSLGPCSEAEWVEYFADEYGPDDSRWPFSRAEMTAFFAGGRRCLERPEPPAG
jgi:hypothetical protein